MKGKYTNAYTCTHMGGERAREILQDNKFNDRNKKYSHNPTNNGEGVTLLQTLQQVDQNHHFQGSKQVKYQRFR